MKREILEGLSTRRIDPRTIKTTETEPRAKGGQGTISVGRRILPEARHAGDTAVYSGWIVLPKEAAKPSPEELRKFVFERKLAIKKLHWNRQDAEATATFFKV